MVLSFKTNKDMKDLERNRELYGDDIEALIEDHGIMLRALESIMEESDIVLFDSSDDADELKEQISFGSSALKSIYGAAKDAIG